MVIFLAGPELNKLRSDLRSSKRAAFARNTKSNLRNQRQTFIIFCIYFALDIMPTSADVLCLFA